MVPKMTVAQMLPLTKPTTEEPRESPLISATCKKYRSNVSRKAIMRTTTEKVNTK
jgi:hypothetical protein